MLSIDTKGIVLDLQNLDTLELSLFTLTLYCEAVPEWSFKLDILEHLKNLTGEYEARINNEDLLSDDQLYTAVININELEERVTLIDMRKSSDKVLELGDAITLHFEEEDEITQIAYSKDMHSEDEVRITLLATALELQVMRALSVNDMERASKHFYSLKNILWQQK